MTWDEHAACRDADPDLFFPEAAGKAHATGPAYAKPRKICAGCPVTTECLAEHLDDLNGMFGGLTPDERTKLRQTTKVRGPNGRYAQPKVRGPNGRYAPVTG